MFPEASVASRATGWRASVASEASTGCPLSPIKSFAVLRKTPLAPLEKNSFSKFFVFLWPPPLIYGLSFLNAGLGDTAVEVYARRNLKGDIRGKIFFQKPRLNLGLEN